MPDGEGVVGQQGEASLMCIKPQSCNIRCCWRKAFYGCRLYAGGATLKVKLKFEATALGKTRPEGESIAAGKLGKRAQRANKPRAKKVARELLPPVFSAVL
jgi:hypothetical protein